MGRKRTGKGKYILFYLACFMTVLFGFMGCIYFQERNQSEQCLIRAKTLMDRKYYKESLEEYSKALRLFPHILGDQALFQMGLIYISPGNANQDYHKSLQYFQRVGNEFPNSEIRGEADTWVFLLHKIIKKGKKIDQLNNKNRFFERALKEKEEITKNLKDQIEKLKEIDLGIEEKKRNTIPKQ